MASSESLEDMHTAAAKASIKHVQPAIINCKRSRSLEIESLARISQASPLSQQCTAIHSENTDAIAAAVTYDDVTSVGKFQITCVLQVAVSNALHEISGQCEQRQSGVPATVTLRHNELVTIMQKAGARH